MRFVLTSLSTHLNGRMTGQMEASSPSPLDMLCFFFLNTSISSRLFAPHDSPNCGGPQPLSCIPYIHHPTFSVPSSHRYPDINLPTLHRPWNYPTTLSLQPLIGAIAAGCPAVLKPSEISSHHSALLAELIPKYLDPEAYAVVNGGIEETTRVLEFKWDHSA